jgi:hypothetical protein
MLAPFASFRESSDPETMVMISRCDLELDFRPLFHADRYRIEFVLLCGNFDDLNISGCCRRLPG